MYISVCICVYIYIYTHTHVYIIHLYTVCVHLYTQILTHVIGLPNIILYFSTNIFFCQYLIALRFLPCGSVTNSSASINLGPLWEKLIVAKPMKHLHIISKIYQMNWSFHLICCSVKINLSIILPFRSTSRSSNDLWPAGFNWNW